MDDISEVKQRADSVFSLGIRTLEALSQQAPPEGHRGVVMAVLSRALTSLQSVSLLAEGGFILDAIGAVRPICELDIDLAYILKDAESRARLFVEYGEVVGLHIAEAHQALYHNDSSASLDEATRRLKERHDAAIGNFPDRFNWASSIKAQDATGSTVRNSIRHRAIATQREHAHSLIYAESCRALHSGLNAITDHVEEISGEGGPALRFHIGPADPSTRPVSLACLCLMQMISTVVDFFGFLDLAAELNVLANESITLESTSDEGAAPA